MPKPTFTLRSNHKVHFALWESCTPAYINLTALLTNFIYSYSSQSCTNEWNLCGCCPGCYDLFGYYSGLRGICINRKICLFWISIFCCWRWYLFFFLGCSGPANNFIGFRPLISGVLSGLWAVFTKYFSEPTCMSYFFTYFYVRQHKSDIFVDLNLCFCYFFRPQPAAGQLQIKCVANFGETAFCLLPSGILYIYLY